MGDATLVGLGFQGNANNRFQSVQPGVGTGGASFYACALVKINESLLVAPTECAYFGNFNNVNAGWEIGRDPDTAASDPPNTPETITLRVKFGAAGAVDTLTYSVDGSTMFGRIHLIGISVVGGVGTLYLNGTAVASLTLSGAFTIGASGLTYGNRSGGGLRSGDPIIAAAYSDTDAAAFISNQKALFDRLRSGGSLTSSITALSLDAQYIYEGYDQKAPNLGVPTTPLKNFGISGVLGDLTFVGTTALVVNIDPDPDYTGGGQSASHGPGGVSLQDAYNNGNTIVTAPGVPVEVDTISFEDDRIGTTAGALFVLPAVAGALLLGTSDAPGASSGNINLLVGAADNPGDLTLTGGLSAVGVGGLISLTGGATNAAASVGGNVSVTGGEGVGADSAGGTVLFTGGVGNGVGPGGDANLVGGAATGSAQGGGAGLTGGTATQGPGGVIGITGGAAGDDGLNGFLGGSINITGGLGGPAAAGGVAGNGGQFIVVTGAGGNATGAGASAGNGGDINIEAGSAGTAAGGASEGFGGALNLSAGTGNAGTGGNASLSSGSGDTQSGDLNIFVGSSNANIGLLTVQGGQAVGLGSGPGGAVLIQGGAPAVGEGQRGGHVDLQGHAGDGVGNGGHAFVTGGASTTGTGGAAALVGGGATGGPGGGVTVQGGQSGGANPGGDVQLSGGTGNGGGGTGGNLFLQSGNGPAAASAGSLQAAFALGSGTPTDTTVGGWYLNPADGRMSLRTYTVGGVDTGALRVHRVNTAGEAAQAVDDGTIAFRTQQGGGSETTVGYRAAKSGDWGLMARVFQRTFTAGEGVTFAVAHNLDCDAPVVMLYNSGTGAFIPIVALVQNSKDQVTVTIGGAVNGFVTVVGF